MGKIQIQIRNKSVEVAGFSPQSGLHSDLLQEIVFMKAEAEIQDRVDISINTIKKLFQA